ncbi:hypothetical protein BT63DRAFT_424892 [Microthyrium microscopicum]|uniref:Uncharacterized protein n=1 Tax=Microthyrium microscopicum TaxID=703497 RepID=A0A6A6UC45_9PEZI|nr:hypothetical protein BT63DRAFT_424892 [Microthyrium microscopicum]
MATIAFDGIPSTRSKNCNFSQFWHCPMKFHHPSWRPSHLMAPISLHGYHRIRWHSIDETQKLHSCAILASSHHPSWRPSHLMGTIAFDAFSFQRSRICIFHSFALFSETSITFHGPHRGSWLPSHSMGFYSNFRNDHFLDIFGSCSATTSLPLAPIALNGYHRTRWNFMSETQNLLFSAVLASGHEMLSPLMAPIAIHGSHRTSWLPSHLMGILTNLISELDLFLPTDVTTFETSTNGKISEKCRLTRLGRAKYMAQVNPKPTLTRKPGIFSRVFRKPEEKPSKEVHFDDENIKFIIISPLSTFRALPKRTPRPIPRPKPQQQPHRLPKAATSRLPKGVTKPKIDTLDDRVNL